MTKTSLQTLLTHAQTILPQHALSRFAGLIANCQHPRLKNAIIHSFLKRYPVNMAEAERPHPEDYTSFNDFFTRALRPGCRELAVDDKAIVSPADGRFAEVGRLQEKQLIQAKGMTYTLDTLFAHDPMAEGFINGQYATIYLAPHDYHRVHMPLTGRLTASLYVPGRLFSVNRMTTDLIPNLYARNERLICHFETTVGPMAVIFVGAMIVGSMQTVWMPQPFRAPDITLNTTPTLTLNKGEELGRFSLGSTVILLFGRDTIRWLPQATPGQTVQVLESIGAVN